MAHAIKLLLFSVYNSMFASTRVRLSPESLELCTEKLGNETGSVEESGIDDKLLSFSNCWTSIRRSNRYKEREARRARSFPPPLTTIRGSDSITVMPHREDGRLVLQLTKLTSCFQAKRTPGRLRLSFHNANFYERPNSKCNEPDHENNKLFFMVFTEPRLVATS